MKKIKFLIFFVILSSCNQYLGTIETNYTPSNEVTEIFSSIKNDTLISEVEFGEIIFPKIINSSLDINNSNLDKIITTDEDSVVNFLLDKIILSKDKNIYLIDNINENNNFEYKLSLKKDEKILYFFDYKDEIYILTNMSHLFLIDGQNVIDVFEYDIYTNTSPIILDESLIIFGVFGDIYNVNLEDSSISKRNNLNSKPGVTIKSNIFEDQDNLYYLFNTGTLVTFEKNNNEHFNNYILDDLNILSSIGTFNELVDSPFSFNEYLYFLDRSGKIAVYNPISSDILWELDINGVIISYLFSNDGYLILMTFDKILILSNNGNLIYSYTHHKELPISIISMNGNIHLISEKGISKLNLKDKKEDSFYKNKFSGDLHIYFYDQIIYFKDNKSLSKLSE